MIKIDIYCSLLLDSPEPCFEDLEQASHFKYTQEARYQLENACLTEADNMVKDYFRSHGCDSSTVDELEIYQIRTADGHVLVQQD